MPVTSPFKFLDAYTKQDKDIFFGRDEEIEELYNLVFQSNLTLVYGQSGTGKTSLVQCGLANRFAQSDWFNIHLRRNEDINKSLLRTLQKFQATSTSRGTLLERLQKKRKSSGKASEKTGLQSSGNEVVDALRGMSKHYLKPIYLLFDQFEELFILGNKAEQEEFYETMAHILDTESYCRVIFIMREESIAQLSDFEKVVPFLFDKRLRVEPMSRAKTEEVITGTTEKFGIQLAGENTATQIIEVLSEGKGRVELTYLQVFLDQLFQEAAERNPNEIVFDESIIRKVGSIEDVLGDFLDRQKNNIQAKLESKYPTIPSSAVSRVLSTFVTLEGTKRPMAREDVQVGSLSDAQVDFVIDELEKGRILRFENNLYELAHDTLALKIAEERGADEVALLQIAKIVHDRYQVSTTTKALLNANELHLINSLRKRLEEEKMLSDEEWTFVKKSAAANRRRRMISISVVAFIIVSLTGFTLYSNSLRLAAQAQKEKAEMALLKQQQAEEERKKAKYSEYLNQGIAHMSNSKYIEAIEAFRLALDFDSTGQVARDSLLSAENKSNISVFFDKLTEEGDALMSSDETKVAAREKYREALELNYNNSLAQSKLNKVTGELELLFSTWKKSGDVFFSQGDRMGFQLALQKYRLCRQVRPNDSYIQERIRQCQLNLK